MWVQYHDKPKYAMAISVVCMYILPQGLFLKHETIFFPSICPWTEIDVLDDMGFLHYVYFEPLL